MVLYHGSILLHDANILSDQRQLEELGPRLDSTRHKGVVIIGILIGNHVFILIWVLSLWGIWLTLVDLIVIVLVEWVRSAEAIKAITLGHLRSSLDKGVIVISILIRHHVFILVWVLGFWSVWLTLVDFIVVVLVERVRSAKAIE